MQNYVTFWCPKIHILVPKCLHESNLVNPSLWYLPPSTFFNMRLHSSFKLERRYGLTNIFVMNYIGSVSFLLIHHNFHLITSNMMGTRSLHCTYYIETKLNSSCSYFAKKKKIVPNIFEIRHLRHSKSET